MKYDITALNRMGKFYLTIQKGATLWHQLIWGHYCLFVKIDWRMEMNYYSEIKRELINNEVNKKVKDYSKNKYELETYLRVGKLLIDAQGGEERAKYG